MKEATERQYSSFISRKHRVLLRTEMVEKLVPLSKHLCEIDK
jgi:hypothetical protein